MRTPGAGANVRHHCGAKRRQARYATLKLPRVPARVSEAFVLRSYPFKEADLVVSFLTRDQGKLRGVARRARRPKSPFGAGLERLSQVRMSYFQRENRELVNLDSCELLVSQFRLLSDYRAAVALDYFAEVTDQLLPAAEPNDKFFRLLAAVLEDMRPRKPGGRLARRHIFSPVGGAAFGLCCPNCMSAWAAAACWPMAKSAAAGVFHPRPRGIDVREMPPRGGRGQLGIERGIESDGGRNVAEAGGANRPGPTGGARRARTCGGSWCSRSRGTSSADSCTPPVFEAE